MHAMAHMPSHADVRVSREVAGGLANGFDWFWSVVMTSWSTAVLSWITLKLTGGVLAVRVECLVRHSLNYDTT